MFSLFVIAACGPPDVESSDEFADRMEQGARARAEAVAESDQRELEVSLRSAREQETIRSDALAELMTGEVEDPDGEADAGEPVTYDELRELCGRSDDRCIVEALVVGPHNHETLTWLADAYDRLGDPEARRRVLRMRHGYTE